VDRRTSERSPAVRRPHPPPHRLAGSPAALALGSAAAAISAAATDPLKPTLLTTPHDPCPARNALIAQTVDQHPGQALTLSREHDGYDAASGNPSRVVAEEERDPPRGTPLAIQEGKR
jgi:hypothetical protein